jgi:hypothetical protein
MSFPQLPNFTIAGPDEFNPPAWWSYTRDDGSVNICATTGGSFIRRIRGAFGLSGAAWDNDLQTALLNRARQFQASQPTAGWQTLVADLEQSLRTATVTPLALRFAIWTSYYQASGLRLDAIDVPEGTVLPRWGVQVPASRSDTLVCFDPSHDPNPVVLGRNDFQTAAQQSSTGIRLHPGESLPSSAPAVPEGPGGLSTGALVVMGLLTVGAVVFVSSTQAKK